jgi:hypothetical protein
MAGRAPRHPPTADHTQGHEECDCDSPMLSVLSFPLLPPNAAGSSQPRAGPMSGIQCLTESAPCSMYWPRPQNGMSLPPAVRQTAASGLHSEGCLQMRHRHASFGTDGFQTQDRVPEAAYMAFADGPKGRAERHRGCATLGEECGKVREPH